MTINHFALNAVDRSAELQGKGASRRLRKQNLVPAIIYGGGEQPTAISIKINELVKSLEFEAFFSHILTLNVDGEEHQVVIKDLQRHPAKGFPMHADFQRVVKGQKINMNVPVHFSGREEAPGTKAGGVLSTLVTDIEIVCIPSQLPEYLEIDVSGMEIGDLFRLSDITLPEGVVIAELELEDGHDRTIVNMQPPTVEEVDEAAEVDAADVPATEQGTDESKDGE
ncbi:MULTISPECIES: 50S ribosomal protein L25/general stress protein Ctc [Psychrobacter]|jgi:large subunit ribosomal protein L25|uniref:Large ribosomal subunit protein bL25 n=1 Tax=Psychrobacter cryohalolentis (strain ATCC BAA-1226 / DSM 17306 / VKM B-2378 / K5) TaxID=335284 RepID=RL25_PSYCK|nr:MULTISPECIES: 50S ribosomal protein L25/general stress protein Ctc [Psychrobacter]Q1QED5.1 RecName: Full=Large ribosomal subunit protein bL25; AltName: Full=50S ribosomal protein L25; AltName: Full=General stress protein CTC [Psychrobacter cryohalolentis K5]ABE73968.1 LSU ribosomal protein L25P [Psychrobacter cryohalolentis K5]ASE26604.1 50S ribosomal protein L25 [Psychrobacter cryohalolentis]KAA0927407.1 50S ribosomal protein L25 [Psychrobacter sp. ANT_H56B]KAA0938992.1 50S ribosomal prote|tara:strand:- start:1727 stop:2401 length:675 start_codon:yes stop_codon:yes gene_type:complete